jgi:hypothetical protein
LDGDDILNCADLEDDDSSSSSSKYIDHVGAGFDAEVGDEDEEDIESEELDELEIGRF